ncbi:MULTISPECIES: MCE family protein [Mycobacterium]|uniref:MCE family protein n=1 Tax=Mycobacterium TaxID=1763 RepID=UPI001CD97511|nr:MULTISPECIES: MCE family protein [Mycobacterium]MCA2246006.1 MCE family protein [Mycobacterium sp. WUMAC-067]MCA2317853.1 MCE family protein [Mycobacterium sp. WUMAC-025]MEE3749808.1 MCE family protein [Mycobacterium intracellulare]
MLQEKRRRRATRVAAVIAAAALSAYCVFTYLAYSDAFTDVAMVTVTAPRAGLVMERDAKVKYLGVQVGKVTGIRYDGEHAELILAVRRDQLAFIPSNSTVRIASTTVFGAKSVEFLEPAHPAAGAVAAGARFTAAAVAVEVNSLFETLLNTLHKIDPVALNATLAALGEGLRDNGNNLGALTTDLNSLLAKVNPRMGALQSDLDRAAYTANVYADAAPALVTTMDNVPTISNTIVRQQKDLTESLLAAAGVADEGEQTLAPAADSYIAAIQRFRAPLNVLHDYSPEYGCLLTALSDAIGRFGPYLGVTKASLFVSAAVLPGAPSYTYPESLPIVNASGGPNCRGLPNLPTKQGSGSWYKTPFLVTDNAYVPYQPNTEMQIDAPSTLQFLFHGSFAERDDY